MVAKLPHGLVIVNTGDGKGKTTAALGMAMRAVGHGMRVAFVQFVKAWSVGEHEAAGRLAPELEVFRMGKGFVVGEATPEHRTAAHEALEFVRKCLTAGRYEVVVADEVLTAAGLGLVTQEDVESLLADRPHDVHLVLTGRGAWDALVAKADMVTEMRLIKHPYDKGMAAQEGIEF
ncbi:MAG: cob(I)yrinic acid a,c-diamide adenosyltransferase [Planctomycetota bacterium]|nr:cob(I)yrinic acid a,c-diamide adenosyltransferase [Planctomycetota bacterium]